MFHSPNLKISILICPTNPRKNVSIDADMFKVYLLPQLGDYKLEHIATINAPNSGVNTPGIPWALLCLNGLDFDGPSCYPRPGVIFAAW